MTTALWLLALLGAIGAFDTLYFHEWRGKLAARVDMVGAELRLHVVRDAIYVVIFGSLPWVEWHGALALVLASLLAAEVAVTFADFVTEDRVRRPLGGLFAGERITHAVMGIVYGAMLAHVAPVLASWLHSPAGMRWTAGPPQPVRVILSAFAVGIFVSGLRDFLALTGRPPRGWPWTAEAPR